MTAQDRNWQRLGEYVARRRHELGLTQPDVEAAGGPSTATVRNIEKAVRINYREGVLRSLERALKWPSGAVDRILVGGEPEASAYPSDDEIDAAEALLRAIRDNPNRSPLLRTMAAAQLEQLAAIRAADRDEEEQQRARVS